MRKRKVPGDPDATSNDKVAGSEPARSPSDDWSNLSQREKFIRTAREESR